MSAYKVISAVKGYKEATNLIKVLSVLNNAFPNLSSAITDVKNAFVGSGGGLKGALSATKSSALGLWSLIKAHPFATVATAITVASVALQMYRKSQEKYQESLRETISTADENIQKYTDEKNSLLSLQSRLEDAKNDKAKLLSIQDELNKAIGETPGLVQNEGNAYDKASAKIQARIKELDELAKKEAQNKINTQKEIFRTNTTPYELGTDNLANVGLDIDIQDAVEELNRLKAERQELIDIGAKEDSIGITDYDKKIARYTQILQGKVKEAKEIFADYIDTEFNDDISKSYANKYIETLIFGGEDDLDNIQGKIDEIKPKIEQFNDLKNKLLDLQVDGKNTDEIALEIQGLIDKIKKASPEVAELMQTSLNSLVPSDETVNAGIEKIKETFKKEFGKEEQSTFNNWINNLSDEDKEIVYDIYCKTDTAKFNLEDWQNALENYNSYTKQTADEIESNLTRAAESTTTLISGISSAQDILSSQTTGTSLSIEDFNSEELEDYRSALEYTNGTMQLNAEKVNEIVKAKSQEQIEINNTNKAMAQSTYLDNAAQIEKLRQKIKDKNFAEGESEESIQNNIDALLEENGAIKLNCDAYDLMNASLQEATDAYHNWLNAQNAAQSGDMFDDTLDAINRINETLNDTDSEYYGRVGRTDYKAALNLIIPDSVNSEDEAKVNAYLKSIYDMFTYDDDGNRAGLNIENFCQKAVDKGLMVLDKSTDSYQIAGQKTMEDFAKGMNLSLPLVQAMFGEMEEFGGEFSWADEAVKTIGDLGVAANESAEALRKIKGNEDLAIKLDVSEIEGTDDKISTLEATIKEMQNVKGKAKVDASEVEYANQIIEYCVAQQQNLSAPIVMSVDTSAISEKNAEAIEQIQEFKRACNDLELKQKLGVDTSDAQSKVNTLATDIKNIDPKIAAELSLDTSSVENLKTSINNITGEQLVKIGIDDSAIIGWTADNKTAKVTYDVDSTAVDTYKKQDDSKTATVTYHKISTEVDQYNPSNLSRTVTYHIKTDGSIGVNGTANVTGTAMAGGNWGAKRGGNTLVGELGREIVVDPHTGRWYTVGDTGAEFVDIPKGSIVFNHKQTESLLANGYVAGRASALVNGTAMVTGGIKRNNAQTSTKSGGNSTSNYGKSSSSKSSSSSSKSSSKSSEEEKEPQIFDWIEIALSRIQRAIDNLSKKAESTFKKLSTRLSATNKEISKVNEEINLQQKAADRYMKEANNVGLSSALAKKVREGNIQISEYDEETQKLIEDYRKWFEKSLECKDAIADLHEELASLYEDNFNNVKDDFENQLALAEHLTNQYENGIDLLEARGYLESTKYYSAMQDATKGNITILNNELAALEQSFSDAMNTGEIEYGSAAWYEMQIAINGVKEEIAEANVELAEYSKTMREIEWGYFDYTQERISQLTQEADFLIDLMSNSDLHTDKGQLTDEGMATMGLHGQNYNVYMSQADQYAQEILEIDKELAKDPYNTELIERREELLGLQQDSILAAEDEKQAIVALVEEGIALELESLQNLIDTYTDALDSAKD